MKKYLIITHRVDLDGIVSSLIAKKYLRKQVTEEDIDILGWNYGDKLPENTDDYENIIMTDICLTPEYMLKYKHKITWIDHHITQIKESEKRGFNDIEGLRRDGIAACELTYEYFFQNKEIPLFVKLIGAYDVWNHVSFDWKTQTEPLQYAIKTEYGVNNVLLEPDFDKLLEDECFLKDIIEKGNYIMKYLSKTWKSWDKNYAFEVEVAGRFSGICMLTPQFGSAPFDAEPEFEKYQVQVSANKKSDGTYNLSLYSSGEDKIGDFNLGEYVKSICEIGSAGGHKLACGMQLTEQQFIRLITERKI